MTPSRIIIREIMHTRGDAMSCHDVKRSVLGCALFFIIIQRLGVNYSGYTSVATLQDIDQIIIFFF